MPRTNRDCGWARRQRLVRQWKHTQCAATTHSAFSRALTAGTSIVGGGRGGFTRLPTLTRKRRLIVGASGETGRIHHRMAPKWSPAGPKFTVSTSALPPVIVRSSIQRESSEIGLGDLHDAKSGAPALLACLSPCSARDLGLRPRYGPLMGFATKNEVMLRQSKRNEKEKKADGDYVHLWCT